MQNIKRQNFKQTPVAPSNTTNSAEVQNPTSTVKPFVNSLVAVEIVSNLTAAKSAPLSKQSNVTQPG